MRTRWTPEEIRILSDTTKTISQIVSATCRTKGAVKDKLRKMKIQRPREQRKKDPKTMSITFIMDNDSIALLRSRDVYTSGEAAKLFAVSSRTMNKWIDNGLLEAYRLAGGKDRRILRENLIAFAHSTGNHIAIKRLAPPIVLVGVDEATKAAIVAENPGREIKTCASGFMAGTLLAAVYSFVVVDSVAVGLNCARQIAIMCGPRAVILMTEDISAAEVAEWEQEKTGAKLLRKPCDIRTVVAAAKEVRL